MKTGLLVVEGDIGNINENIFKSLKEKVLSEEISAGNDAMKEAGGIPIGVKVKNRSLSLNKDKNLLRAEVIYEIRL